MSNCVFTIVLCTIPIFLLKYIIEKIFGPLHLKVDENCSKYGGQLVAKFLKENKIDAIFTLCGGHISPILVACEELNIKVIDVRNEATASFAADAYGRLSGKFGVAVVTAGPGVTNCVTAIRNASMAESPVLLIGGAAATLTKGRGSLQDVDQLSLFKHICKYNATVSRVSDIVPTLKHACEISLQGKKGPVFVEIPINLLYSYPIVHKEFLAMNKSSASLISNIIRWYVSRTISTTFHEAFTKNYSYIVENNILKVNKKNIEYCCELIMKSKKPIILIGSQSLLIDPYNIHKMRAALEKVKIPCYLSSMARGLLGPDCSFNFKQQRKIALKQADLIILAGTVCDFRLSYGSALGKCPIISVNLDKNNASLNSDVFWKPNKILIGHPGVFLQDLCNSIMEKNIVVDWNQWVNELTLRENESNLQIVTQINSVIENGLNPLRILKLIDEYADNDSMFIGDGGDFVGSAAYILRPRGSLKWLDAGPFGTLGTGVGFTIGSHFAFKSFHRKMFNELWIIFGDGSVGFSLADFDTLVRHKIPTIAVIGNDGCWSQILREQYNIFKCDVGCYLKQNRYDKIIEGFDGIGFVLDKESTDDHIIETLKKAKDLYKNGHVVVINALIGQTKFRDGSISV